MTEAKTVQDSAWPLSEVEIAALHAQYRPQVEAALGRLPQDMPLPEAEDSFEAQLTKVEIVGTIVGLLLAVDVPPHPARWLGIDIAARLLNEHARLQAADPIGAVAGHA